MCVHGQVPRQDLKKAIVNMHLLFFVDYHDQIVCGLQSKQEFYKGSSARKPFSKTKANTTCKQQSAQGKNFCDKAIYFVDRKDRRLFTT